MSGQKRVRGVSGVVTTCTTTTTTTVSMATSSGWAADRDHSDGEVLDGIEVTGEADTSTNWSSSVVLKEKFPLVSQFMRLQKVVRTHKLSAMMCCGL